MSSKRPPVPRGLQQQPSSDSIQVSERHLRRQPDLNRPLPPTPTPASSLPNEYDIPTLRRKPVPESSPQTQSGHARSISHPFPSFFGGSKRNEKKSVQEQNDSSEDGLAHTQKQKLSKNKKIIQPKSASKEPVTGKCMTCDATVRWPQDLKVFRCTTCLTINDLEPADPMSDSSPNNGHKLPAKIVPISVDRIREMIETSIDEYFQRILASTGAAPQRTNDDSFLLNGDDDLAESSTTTSAIFPGPEHTPPRPRFQDRSPSDPTLHLRRPLQPSKDIRQQRPPAIGPFHPSGSIRRGLSHQQNRPRGRSIAGEIFKNVESHIASVMTGCATLNASFFTSRPTETRPEPPLKQKQVRQEPDFVMTPSSEQDAFLSELDAKTLLLGDVVENGSWWTGKYTGRDQPSTEQSRERSPERTRGVITAKTPRINWLELAEWYRLVLHAGDDWRRRWHNLRSTLLDDQLSRWQAVPIEMLQRAFADSQIHLQRTLLKATENLLKRPRRPLSNPEDSRFLLMLLANPLLAPASSRSSAVRSNNDSSERTTNGTSGSPVKSNPVFPARNSSGLGRHSGIVKRVLGLLAHLANDVQLFLISWFSRLADAHFTSLVELIGSFVTYRLTRQPAKPTQVDIDPTEGLIPNFTDHGTRHVSEMHAAIEGRSQATQKQTQDGKPILSMYSEDWQIKAAARVMALLFQANTGHVSRKRDTGISSEQRARSAGLNAKHQANMHGQMIPISHFYNSMVDHADVIADFEAWESTKTKFTFCQYPFFLSIWAKIHILEHDAKRQMEIKAREAFFDSIMTRKVVSQYLLLKVRRDCLVDDSLKSVSEAIGRGANDVKKGLRVDFIGEEGVDAGGLRKEWFLLLVREIFNPNHGLFVYDEESQYCYFNPFCLESSEQFFLVGVLLGLAIYNSTILDVAFPPFVFKKMLASAPATEKGTAMPKVTHQYTLEDLAELKPSLARGLRQLLEFDGDVQGTFCRDFEIEMERYGEKIQIPLCSNGSNKPVTNANRREFVGLYVHYLLDQSVTRQYEPFKRGFFTVCNGNALALFRPEEIELLVRGSEEPLDVNSLRLVASYDGWPKHVEAEKEAQVVWFWEFFAKLDPGDQRKLLSFITGSDRIPAMGATNLSIRVQLLLDKESLEQMSEPKRLPIARTCFNLIGLYQYRSRTTLEQKLWTALTLSEGFGMK